MALVYGLKIYFLSKLLYSFGGTWWIVKCLSFLLYTLCTNMSNSAFKDVQNWRSNLFFVYIYIYLYTISFIRFISVFFIMTLFFQQINFVVIVCWICYFFNFFILKFFFNRYKKIFIFLRTLYNKQTSIQKNILLFWKHLRIFKILFLMQLCIIICIANLLCMYNSNLFFYF